MSESFADLLGQVDVAFVVDTTGSMGPFIDEARRRIREIADAVAAADALDLRFAVVEYRDHPPQEESFIARPFPFTDSDGLQRILEGLQPVGGGDAPEAVLDGLVSAANLQWRTEADKLCFLVGDAPPHGSGGMGDHWPHGCPCRATPNGVVELFKGRDIRLNAVALTPEPALVASFRELAEATGGSFTEAAFDPERAVGRMGASLEATGMTVGMSRLYVETAERIGTYDPAEIAPAMAMPEDAAKGLLGYLRRRGLKK